MGGDACVMASWPSAGAAVPRVKPPANVAPLFRSSRRLKRFEPIGLSFADEPQKEIAYPKPKVYARLGVQSSKSGVPLDLPCQANFVPSGERRTKTTVRFGFAW